MILKSFRPDMDFTPKASKNLTFSQDSFLLSA